MRASIVNSSLFSACVGKSVVDEDDDDAVEFLPVLLSPPYIATINYVYH